MCFFFQTNIANEIETIENPTLRLYFEKIKFDNRNEEETKKTSSSETIKKPRVLAVCPIQTIESMVSNFQAIQSHTGNNCEIEIKSSLQELLDSCSYSEKVFLLPGFHSLSFSEFLFGRGDFFAALDNTTINAKNNENTLITLNGNFKFTNIIFDCSNVRNGLTTKAGSNVEFINCTFEAGDDNQSGSIGVIASGAK